MKSSYLYAFIALFAVALVLGCIGGGGGSNNTTAAGGGVTVTPTQVVAGGTVTIQYMLQNNYENDMSNVQVSLIGLPSTFTGTTSLSSIGTVVSNQQYPAIFTITAPQTTNVKQSITPKLQVCYDYNTNYFFDSALKTTSLATETVTTESGSSSGPVSVSQLGLDSVFTNTIDHVGSLQITNTGSGKITKFHYISINTPANSKNIASVRLTYSSCGGTSGLAQLTGALPGLSSSPVIPNNSGLVAVPTSITNPTLPVQPSCDILTNSLAISNGLTATIKMNTTTAAKSITAVTPERIDGTVSYNYCTEIPVGTITICPAGKAC